MSDRGYKVRIRPPERGDVGMLVAMIGPLVELDQAALSRALAHGPAIVGDDMALAEAEQMLAVFTSLGADAELLMPDGSVNDPGQSLRGTNTLPLHAKGIAAALDAVATTRNPTQPFDGRALRAAAERRQGSMESAGGTHPTRPFNPRALRGVASQLRDVSTLDGPFRSDQAPHTRPIQTGQFHSLPRSTAQRATPPHGQSIGKATPPQGLPADKATPPQGLPADPSTAGEPPTRPIARVRLAEASRPPRGEPIRAGGPALRQAALSRPPRELPADARGSLPPPGQAEELPPLDEVVEQPGAASVAFQPAPRSARPTPPVRGQRAPHARDAAPRRSDPARAQLEHPPEAITDSHPRPDRQRAMAIRERVTDSRSLPPSHSPLTAVLLATLLPGMGQLYNGQRNRAVWFAVGSLVILPWLWSIVDAGRVASAINDQRHPRPRGRERRSAIPGQLVLDFAVFVALAGGLTLLTHALQQHKGVAPASVASAPASRAPATTAPVTAATAAPNTAAPVTAAPVTAAPATAASRAPQSKAPAQQDIDSLLAEGRTACGEGQYAACERLMRAIIARKPRHHEAHQLLVDAISQQGGRGTGTSPSKVAPISEAP